MISRSDIGGVWGKGAVEALRIQGWDLPEQPNRLVASINQSFVMALSQREFWVLDPTMMRQHSQWAMTLLPTLIPSSAKAAMRGSY